MLQTSLCQVAVEEDENDISFLYKIKSGGADKSYGIHVATIAGFPQVSPLLFSLLSSLFSLLSSLSSLLSSLFSLLSHTHISLTLLLFLLSHTQAVLKNSFTILDAIQKNSNIQVATGDADTE